MVVIYFFALLFTLAMATADVSLAKHWTDWDPDTLCRNYSAYLQ